MELLGHRYTFLRYGTLVVSLLFQVLRLIMEMCMKLMKDIFVTVCLSLGVSTAAEAQVRGLSISNVCPKVQAAGAESSTIYKQSAPLRSGGVGTPLIGYRKEMTLIYNRRNFSGGSHVIYDSKGKSLASCPVTSAHGHAGRARCTALTSVVRRAAIRNSGSPSVYFKINKNLCVKVPDAGRCVGSVKGLCNSLIS